MLFALLSRIAFADVALASWLPAPPGYPSSSESQVASNLPTGQSQGMEPVPSS